MAIFGQEAIAAPRLSVSNFWKIGKIARSTSFSSERPLAPSTFGVLCTCAGAGFFRAWLSAKPTPTPWWWWWWWWWRWWWCWWLHLSRLFSDTERCITVFSSSITEKCWSIKKVWFEAALSRLLRRFTFKTKPNLNTSFNVHYLINWQYLPSGGDVPSLSKHLDLHWRCVNHNSSWWTNAGALRLAGIEGRRRLAQVCGDRCSGEYDGGSRCVCDNDVDDEDWLWMQ